ncbi:MAG: TetR/AcrR family transcriptional regulator [Deltaproteobacteria bacterium]|jgi:AcrR family transcriptional regulator|nr:TetR/AcrR family transcriptional regulator [Deltaproteobacteria bacterium]MBW2529883.1 TetR/AcrR family transcriptional regulator [Deltaproteobacteria bacterium]
MDVRSEILRAATELFAARGFDGTSLQAIADAVGIRKASLLYHFRTKEELRLSVLAAVLDRWNEVLPRLLMAASAGERRFGAVIGEVARFFATDPDRARLLVREILDRPEDMKRRLETYVAPWVDVVADLIRKGQDRGEVHLEVDAEAYVLQIINLVVSGVALAASLSGALLPLDSPAGPPMDRHHRELIRIARTSLFRVPPTPTVRPGARDEDEDDQEGNGAAPSRSPVGPDRYEETTTAGDGRR